MNGGLDPVHFLGHGGADDLFALNQRPDQVQVCRISGNRVNGCQNVAGPF
jgi:hypothetical protein